MPSVSVSIRIETDQHLVMVSTSTRPDTEMELVNLSEVAVAVDAEQSTITADPTAVPLTSYISEPSTYTSISVKVCLCFFLTIQRYFFNF